MLSVFKYIKLKKKNHSGINYRDNPYLLNFFKLFYVIIFIRLNIHLTDVRKFTMASVTIDTIRFNSTPLHSLDKHQMCSVINCKIYESLMQTPVQNCVIGRISR